MEVKNLQAYKRELAACFAEKGISMSAAEVYGKDGSMSLNGSSPPHRQTNPTSAQRSYQPPAACSRRYFLERDAERKASMGGVRQEGRYEIWVEFYLQVLEEAMERTKRFVVAAERLHEKSCLAVSGLIYDIAEKLS